MLINPYRAYSQRANPYHDQPVQRPQAAAAPSAANSATMAVLSPPKDKRGVSAQQRIQLPQQQDLWALLQQLYGGF